MPHGSYNLEKVLNFSSRLEKSLNSVKVLEKYLISLLGLEKSLKFGNLFIPYHFSENQMILPGKFVHWRLITGDNNGTNGR